MYFSQGQSWLGKQKSVEIAHVVWYKINMDIKISALSDTNKGSMYLFRLSKHYWANILIDSWYESVARENKSFCTQHIISLKNIINETESSSKFLRMRQLDLFWMGQFSIGLWQQCRYQQYRYFAALFSMVPPVTCLLIQWLNAVSCENASTSTCRIYTNAIFQQPVNIGRKESKTRQ